MLFYGYFWVAFISLDDFFKKYAYKTSKKIKFIGTTGRRAKRQVVEPNDRSSSQTTGRRARRQAIKPNDKQLNNKQPDKQRQPPPDIQYIC